MTDLRAVVALARESSLARPRTPLAMGKHLDGGMNSVPHLEYLSDRLAAATARVEQGESVWLKVSMPPRAGKSTTCSVHFPTWMLAKHPDWKIGMLSHDPGLATGFGRNVRRTVEEHGELGIQIARDAGAASEWETTRRGGIVARSVGQSVTGRGFKVMIMDDIVKDFKAAHSAHQREENWNWWQANSRTRLEPPSLTVAIGTRWHEDDILGRLTAPEYQNEGPQVQWEDIVFPAIAEENDVLGRSPGDPLYSPMLQESRDQAIERWMGIKASVGSYVWAALYQQRPAPAEGAIFNTEWWNYWSVGDLPKFEKTITSWDCAFKDTDSSDYVVGQRWGVHGPNRYLLEQVRGKWSFTETLKQMREFIGRTNLGWPQSHEHVVEDKANGTAVIDVLRREIPGMIGVSPTNSKEARARAVTPQIESGNVFLPAVAPWLEGLLMEAQSFPSALHDDQVDALTQALTRLTVVAGPPVVHDVSQQQLTGW